jgi:hypothetical protein
LDTCRCEWSNRESKGIYDTTKITKVTEKNKVGFVEIDALSKKIIGLAIETHRQLGPRLLESAYQQSLAYELSKNNIPFELEKKIPVMYNSVHIDCAYRADIVVDNEILLEFK